MSDTTTPSGRIVAAANKEVQVTDARGRKLSVRRLGALDRARLFKAIGGQNSQNAPYLGMAMLASSVTTMDDIPLPFPATDREVEAAIARLDDDGINAVADALSGTMAPEEQVSESDRADAALAAKNAD
jgi:hypothetical protein